MSKSGFDERRLRRALHWVPGWLQPARLRARGPARLAPPAPFAAAETAKARRHG
jgi:hypothetical protein